MGALDAGTGEHGKFCVCGAGRGRGKGADESQPASTETSFLSGRCATLALPFDPRLRCWHRPSSGRQGHPHSQGPGRAHEPPAPPPSTHSLASALNSGAQKQEGRVRREIHFLKCHLNRYVFTFMHLGGNTGTPQARGLVDRERTGLPHLEEREAERCPHASEEIQTRKGWVRQKPIRKGIK